MSLRVVESIALLAWVANSEHKADARTCAISFNCGVGDGDALGDAPGDALGDAEGDGRTPASTASKAMRATIVTVLRVVSVYSTTILRDER
jgi:hypothetical protein